MDRSPIRVGVLGAARIAPPALLKPGQGRRDVEVVCVAARDRGRAEAMAAAHGVPEVEDDYAAVVGRSDIDLIYVPLPPALHAKWCIRALESGKAVLCEKPFAASEEDACAMVAAADRSGLPLIEAFHYRFHRVMRRVVELVSEEAIGRLVRIEAVHKANAPYPDTLWRGDLGCGALEDLGCYPLHAMRTLAGEPEVMTARAESAHGANAVTEADLMFPGGVPGRMSCSMVATPREWWMRVEGERGLIEISNFIAPQLFGCDFAVTIDGVRHVEPTEGPTTYEAQLDHVVEVIRGAAPALTGGQDAVANVALMDAIRRAAR